MILSKKEQDDFFDNYLPLLFYTAVYEGILPEGSIIMDFGNLPIEDKVDCRDALFSDPDILEKCLEDNAANFSKENKLFIKNIQDGILADFVVLKQYKKYVVLLEAETGLFYEVHNITEPFEKLLSYIPSYITVAIFNFNGKIVCDGLIVGGNMHIGPNNEASFLQQYRESKSTGLVINLL